MRPACTRNVADLLQDAAGYPPWDRRVRQRLEDQHVEPSGQSYQALKGKAPTEWRRTAEDRVHKVPFLLAKRAAAAGTEPEQKRSRRNDDSASGAAASSSGSGRNRDAASRPRSSGSGGSYYGSPQDALFRSRR